MKEIWRNIKGFEGLYQVSNYARVKSLNYRRTGKERVLKTKRDKDGYFCVNLCKDGVSKHFFVHRLVAEAFIPNPENKPCIDHIIPISEGGGNEVFNLRWATQKENCGNLSSRQNYSKAKKGGKGTWYGKCGTLHPKSKPVIGVNRETGEEVWFAGT